jgi:hypothetical protein
MPAISRCVHHLPPHVLRWSIPRLPSRLASLQGLLATAVLYCHCVLYSSAVAYIDKHFRSLRPPAHSLILTDDSDVQTQTGSQSDIYTQLDVPLHGGVHVLKGSLTEPEVQHSSDQ